MAKKTYLQPLKAVKLCVQYPFSKVSSGSTEANALFTQSKLTALRIPPLWCNQNSAAATSNMRHY